MSRDKAPDAMTTCALNRSAVTYDRRDAIVSLLAVPIALTVGMSSATEAVEYPVWVSRQEAAASTFWVTRRHDR